MADDDPPPPPPAAVPNNGNGDTALHDAIRDGLSLKAIRSIVQRDPPSVRVRSSSGMWHVLPLHAAIQRMSPRSVIRFLLEQWTDAVKECDDDEHLQNLPAHLACREGMYFGRTDPETAQRVIEAWPEALLRRNAHGHLPLQLARDVRVVRLLVQRWPERVEEADSEGMTLLHRAVACGCDLPVIRFYGEQFPHMVRARDRRGRTPLHDLSHSTPLEVVRYLVEQHPEALRVLDEDGYVPLHCAAENDLSEPVLVFLVDGAPETVGVRSKENGSTPLHLAAMSIRNSPNNNGHGAVRRMVEACPEALRVATNNDEGHLPLHCAAQCTNFPLVPILAGPWPGSVRVKSAKGWLALHLALQSCHTERSEADEVRTMYQTARFLMDMYPESALEPTNEGCLPLHVAAMRGFGFEEDDDVHMELEFFQNLVRRAPAAIRVMSNELLLPFQYAIKDGQLSLEPVQFLVEQFPDAVRLTDDDGRTAMHMAVSRSHVRLDLVQFVAEQRPELLGTTDLKSGSTPLHVAVAQVQSPSDVARFCDEESEDGEQVEFELGQLLEIVRYLVEQRPQSLTEADCRGCVPLHVAVSRIVPDLDMVKLLVEARPEALVAADRAGSLPLHVAVALHQPTPALTEFLAAKACHGEDDDDDDHRAAMALRVAQVRRDNAHPLVQLLVEHSPSSVQHKNKNGMAALLVATENDVPLDVLFFLATAWPESISGSRRRHRPASWPHAADDDAVDRAG